MVCFQTGPKGVIQDYRRYKQLETEQRKEKEKEMRSLAQKFSVSCQSSVSCSCSRKSNPRNSVKFVIILIRILDFISFNGQLN